MSLAILRTKTFWIVGILGVALLYPFESTVVPSQKVLVVTEDWRPIQDIAVRQIWQHYSFESRGHEQDSRTDDGGRVTFPRRSIRASILRRTLHPLWNIIRQGVHASFGVHTQMFTADDSSQKPLGKGPVKAQEGDIVIRLP